MPAWQTLIYLCHNGSWTSGQSGAWCGAECGSVLSEGRWQHVNSNAGSQWRWRPGWCIIHGQSDCGDISASHAACSNSAEAAGECRWSAFVAHRSVSHLPLICPLLSQCCNSELIIIITFVIHADHHWSTQPGHLSQVVLRVLWCTWEMYMFILAFDKTHTFTILSYS